MKAQERRRLERDRHPTKPPRLNPKGTKTGDQAIQDAEVRGAAPGTVENHELMFGENGFCNNGPYTAGPSDPHKRGDGMDEEDYEIAHPLSYQFPNPYTFNVLGISPGTGLRMAVHDGVLTVIRIRTAERDHKGEFYALYDYVTAFPTLKLLLNLHAIEDRLLRLFHEINAGGKESIGGTLTLSEQISTKDISEHSTSRVGRFLLRQLHT